MVQETRIQTDRVVTLPNVLSLLRLVGVPVFLWLVLVPEADTAAAVLLMVAGFTDWLDGYLARRWHQISRVGQLLDPVADRLYILATLLGLGLRGIVPWWFVALIVGRDVVLAATLPILRRAGYGPLPVHYLGKSATLFLLLAFPLLLLGVGDGLFATAARAFGWAFAIWGTALYWWAGAAYLWQVRRLVAGSATVTGSEGRTA